MTVTRIAVAVVESDGQFLVGQRGPGGDLPGAAEFPGGKVEPGESPACAAVRECREETSLGVEAVSLHSVVSHRYDHGELELHFFLCRPAEPTERPEVPVPWRWLPRKDLATLPFPAANKALVADLVEGRA